MGRQDPPSSEQPAAPAPSPPHEEKIQLVDDAAGDGESSPTDASKDNNNNSNNINNSEMTTTTTSDAELNNDNESGCCTSRKMKCLLLQFCIGFILGGIGVGLYFYFTSSSQQEGTRYDQLMAFFIENEISTSNDFDDPQSPQSKAIEFLAYEDDNELNLLNIPTTSRKSNALDTPEGYALLTRYVLSVMYYSLNGNQWNRDLFFLKSDKDICDWYEILPQPIGQVGVFCNDDSNEIVGLSFIENNLEGEIPKELGYLTTLQYFESIGNNLMGTLPETLSQLTNLRTLLLIRGSLEGPLPTWIGNFQYLESLYLSNNAFVGSIPSTLHTNLSNLRGLALDDNNLDGTLNDFFATSSMFALEYLYLEDNAFVGQLPTSIQSIMPNLIHFDLSSNKLNGPLPQDLFQLSNLEIIDLHSNMLSSSLPSSSSNTNTNNLKYLALYDNNLSGIIPDSFGNTLPALQHLDLANNSFQGDIPDLSPMTNLEYLYLSNNPFTTGPIPTFIQQNLGLLRELSLKGTNRNGQLYNLFPGPQQLVLLDLDNNMLTGFIPSNINQEFQHLQFLLLNRNQLSGVVPDTELSTMSNLRVLLLDRNDVTGSLDLTCQLNSIKLAISDCDEVFCPCCNPCCDVTTTCDHDFDSVSNSHPVWELGYRRQYFRFSDLEENSLIFGVGDDDVLVNAPEP